MTESPLARIVEITENGRHLSKDRGFLTVDADGQEIGRVPLDDLGAVIATAPGTTVSCALIAELAARGLPLVLCGRNFTPVAIVWPIAGHHAQQRRMESQIDAPPALRQKLWAAIVAAKVRAQGAALATLGRRAGAFDRLARSVDAGDPTNIEARAARRYWPLMMGAAFRRDTDGDGVNAMLNYGYAVLRAGTARAIVAAGLHPGIGIFHRHPANAMPLADDLMEPFRPWVDVAVHALVAEGRTTVDPPVKTTLAAILAKDLRSAAGRTPISTGMIGLAQSLSASFVAQSPRLDLPIHGDPFGDRYDPDDGDPDHASP
ncbi:MAG: type II CRISPR-associated endonuclease Cas1 [Rhodospirillales bacterium]|jgi:CRISPR-associated protein Cas1